MKVQNIFANASDIRLRNFGMCLIFRMESSELVQRLQAQVLELRAENCEIKEREKFGHKKALELDQQREELEKQLKPGFKNLRSFYILVPIATNCVKSKNFLNRTHFNTL